MPFQLSTKYIHRQRVVVALWDLDKPLVGATARRNECTQCNRIGMQTSLLINMFNHNCEKAKDLHLLLKLTTLRWTMFVLLPIYKRKSVEKMCRVGWGNWAHWEAINNSRRKTSELVLVSDTDKLVHVNMRLHCTLVP